MREAFVPLDALCTGVARLEKLPGLSPVPSSMLAPGLECSREGLKFCPGVSAALDAGFVGARAGLARGAGVLMAAVAAVALAGGA